MGVANADMGDKPAVPTLAAGDDGEVGRWFKRRGTGALRNERVDPTRRIPALALAGRRPLAVRWSAGEDASSSAAGWGLTLP